MNLKVKAFLKRINRTKIVHNTRQWIYFENKILKHKFKPQTIEIDNDAYNKLCQLRKFDGIIPNLNISDDNSYDVSIIVPCYNVGPFVKECVESIINQKTQYKYEIILINDGSTDNTLDIINEYKDLDNVVIVDKPNSGPGQSRNIAIEKSRGKYIIFVDSDDYLTEYCVDDLLNAAYSKDFDLVEAQHVNIGGGTGIKPLMLKMYQKINIHLQAVLLGREYTRKNYSKTFLGLNMLGMKI